MRIHLDFETTATLDLRQSGTWMYSRHPDTDVLCCGFSIDDSEVCVWSRGQEIPVEFSNPEAIFISFNVFFERAIWKNIMVERYGWPEIEEDQWRCSAALAASYALPRRLEQVADVLGLKNRKDPRGQKLILKTNGKNRKELTPDEFETLCDYCAQDVSVERELAEFGRTVVDAVPLEDRPGGPGAELQHTP